MSFLMLVSLAWRNLWRQRRRTLLTLLSIAFGGFLSVMITAMQDRSFADFIDNAARLGSGHVAIQHPEYRDTPTLTRTVKGANDKRSVAEQDPAVSRAVTRAQGQAMVATASDSFGAMFIAYDPTVETKDTFRFPSAIVEGQAFTGPGDDGIVLGQALATNLGAHIGDKIVFTLTDRNGEIVSGMERVTGIVKTGAATLDAALVLLPIDTVRKVVGYDPDESTQVAVFLNDGRDAPGAAERIAAGVGKDVAVLTWDEIQPEIRSFVAMKVGGSRFMELVFALLVVAGIFNTIFMSVLERTREFGIMMAIGYTARQLFGLVMLESTFLALLGLAASAALTAWPYWRLASTGLDLTEAYSKQGIDKLEIGGVGLDPILRIGIFPENAAFIAIAIVVATLLAGLYPAWRAGRVNPVESINLA